MTLGQKRSRSSSRGGNRRSNLRTPADHVHPLGTRGVVLVLWRAVNLRGHCSCFVRTSYVVLRACRLVLRSGFASSVVFTRPSFFLSSMLALCNREREQAETQREQRQQHPQRQSHRDTQAQRDGSGEEQCRMRPVACAQS